MALALPRFVALKAMKSNNYLEPDVGGKSPANPEGWVYVQAASGTSALSPYTKHEVVPSNQHQGMVHIRCCYNNKYWKRISPQGYADVVADAEKPDEDTTSWSCTLWEPSQINLEAKTFRLRLVQAGLYPIILSNEHLRLVAYLEQPDNDNQHDVFTFTDWDSLVALPRYIAFKGDNGQYLAAHLAQGLQYLRFLSENPQDPLCMNEVVVTLDGSVLIKNTYFNKFWSVNNNNKSILADNPGPGDNPLPNALFQPVKVEGNVIALHNVGNKMYCKRYTNQVVSGLSAIDHSISQFAKLQVVELVNSRHIYQVYFRLTDARIYNEEVVVLATEHVANQSNKSSTMAIIFTYEDSWSRTWSDTTSWKLSVVNKMESDIPIIGDSGIQILPDKFDGSYQWGETLSSLAEKETMYSVTLPAQSEVTVTLSAIKATCEIPFSYHQRDTLSDGKRITSYMVDGVYSGANYFKFTYGVSEPRNLN